MSNKPAENKHPDASKERGAASPEKNQRAKKNANYDLKTESPIDPYQNPPEKITDRAYEQEDEGFMPDNRSSRKLDEDNPTRENEHPNGDLPK